MSGWIKLHRRSLDNPLFRKPGVWHYWQYCLLKANHAPQKIIWNKKEIIIERGSFITGRNKAMAETGLTARKVRTALTTLSNLNMISINKEKSSNQFTYVSVCNYDKYNTQEKTSDQQATSKRPASDQQATTNKNEKKDKNEKKEDKPPISPKKKEVDMEAVKDFFSLWNKYAVNGITPARDLTDGRIAKIKTRLKEEPGLDYWEQIFSKLQKIPFYCGDNNRGWTATLDYIIHNDTNHRKVYERRLEQGKKLTNNEIAVLELRRKRESGEQ